MLEPRFDFFSWSKYFAVSLFLNDAHLINGAHFIKMHTAFLAVALINIHFKRFLGWAGILLDGRQRNDRQLLAIVLYNIAPVGSAHFFSRTLFSQTEKATYFVKFNVDGLLRGDYQSRMNGYATARQNGWMSANDIRELENLDRIPSEEGGDLYLINGNMLPLKNAGAFADTTSDDGKEETSDEEQEVLGVEKSGRRNRTGGKSPGA